MSLLRDLRLLGLALACTQDSALGARVSSKDGGGNTALTHDGSNASTAASLRFSTDVHVQLTSDACRHRERDMTRDSLVGLALGLQLDREARGPSELAVWDPWSGLICDAMEQGSRWVDYPTSPEELVVDTSSNIVSRFFDWARGTDSYSCEGCPDNFRAYPIRPDRAAVQHMHASPLPPLIIEHAGVIEKVALVTNRQARSKMVQQAMEWHCKVVGLVHSVLNRREPLGDNDAAGWAELTEFRRDKMRVASFFFGKILAMVQSSFSPEIMHRNRGRSAEDAAIATAARLVQEGGSAAEASRMVQQAEISRLYSMDDVDLGANRDDELSEGINSPARDLALLATSRVIAIFEQLLNDAWPGHHDMDLLGGGPGVCDARSAAGLGRPGDPCMEGAIIPAGRSCTPRCDHGFRASAVALRCSEDGTLSPATFTCSDQESGRPAGDGGSGPAMTTAAADAERSWVHNLGVALSVTEAAEDTCNGIYLIDREYNGRPLYKSRAGAIIFFDNGWKMNWRDSVDGYHFSAEGSQGPLYPIGGWRVDSSSHAGSSPPIVELRQLDEVNFDATVQEDTESQPCIGGWRGPPECVFPFRYGSDVYESCTEENSGFSSSEAWCSHDPRYESAYSFCEACVPQPSTTTRTTTSTSTTFWESCVLPLRVAKAVSCADGSTIFATEDCEPQCEDGFEPSQARLACDGDEGLLPANFRCVVASPSLSQSCPPGYSPNSGLLTGQFPTSVECPGELVEGACIMQGPEAFDFCDNEVACCGVVESTDVGFLSVHGTAYLAKACPAELLDADAFGSCVKHRECKAPNGIADRALGGPCAGGAITRSGSACETQCADGFEPSEASLSCSEGTFSPRTFECVPRDSDAGASLVDIRNDLREKAGRSIKQEWPFSGGGADPASLTVLERKQQHCHYVRGGVARENGGTESMPCKCPRGDGHNQIIVMGDDPDCMLLSRYFDAEPLHGKNCACQVPSWEGLCERAQYHWGFQFRQDDDGCHTRGGMRCGFDGLTTGICMPKPCAGQTGIPHFCEGDASYCHPSHLVRCPGEHRDWIGSLTPAIEQRSLYELGRALCEDILVFTDLDAGAGGSSAARGLNGQFSEWVPNPNPPAALVLEAHTRFQELVTGVDDLRASGDVPLDMRLPFTYPAAEEDFCRELLTGAATCAGHASRGHLEVQTEASCPDAAPRLPHPDAACRGKCCARFDGDFLVEAQWDATSGPNVVLFELGGGTFNAFMSHDHCDALRVELAVLEGNTAAHSGFSRCPGSRICYETCHRSSPHEALFAVNGLVRMTTRAPAPARTVRTTTRSAADGDGANNDDTAEGHGQNGAARSLPTLLALITAATATLTADE